MNKEDVEKLAKADPEETAVEAYNTMIEYEGGEDHPRVRPDLGRFLEHRRIRRHLVPEEVRIVLGPALGFDAVVRPAVEPVSVL